MKGGLTINAGIRLDKETQPPFDPVRFPTVKFGFGDKIGPNFGAAYDVLHNGKLKVYASWRQLYDLMKMGLARGSFGSDYWHNCVYAMDDTDYTKITPSYPAGGGCPATGPAPGVTVGRFIENVDFRATKADPRDPAIAPDMKPMKQHEFVTGLDWEVRPNWSFTFRYCAQAASTTRSRTWRSPTTLDSISAIPARSLLTCSIGRCRFRAPRAERARPTPTATT
jgi:hypothetical protein